MPVNPAEEFARGWKLVSGIAGDVRQTREHQEDRAEGQADRAQRRLDATEDRTWTRDQRGREQKNWDYEDQSRVDPTLKRAADQSAYEATLADVPLKAAQREADLAGTLTAEEATRKKRSDLARDEGAGTLQRLSIRGAEQTIAANDAALGEQGEMDELLTQIQASYSPQAQALSDPQYRDDTMNLFSAFVEKDQNIQEGITNETMMGWANKTFAENLQNGVGSKLDNGHVITNKRIIQAYRTKDKKRVVLRLAVRAKDPNTGKEYEYEDNVTKNRRNADPTDEVLEILIEDVQKRLGLAAAAVADVERGFDIDRWRRGAVAQYLAKGGDAKTIEALAGGAVPGVSSSYTPPFDGKNMRDYNKPASQAKGVQPLSPRERADKIAAKADALRKDADSETTWDELVAQATEEVDGLYGAQEAAAGGSESIPEGFTVSGRTKDGQRVLADAQGNQFIEE